MAEGKRKDDWHHTAKLCVMLAEPHRDRKKRSKPYSEEDFHPYAHEIKQVRRTKVSKAEGMRLLRAAFVDGKVK